MDALQVKEATLRDWFAAMAVPALVEMHRPRTTSASALVHDLSMPYDTVAAMAYAVADAMLNARTNMKRAPGRALQPANL